MAPRAAAVSLLSAPWPVLAFAAGCIQRDPLRAALLGLGCTVTALLGLGVSVLVVRKVSLRPRAGMH